MHASVMHGIRLNIRFLGTMNAACKERDMHPACFSALSDLTGGRSMQAMHSCLDLFSIGDGSNRLRGG